MRQATIDGTFIAVLGRVREVAASQGWLLSAGGSPQAPQEPMTFRRGLGAFAPANGLVVQLASVDANRTEVTVTAWRGNAPGSDYDADRMLQALRAHPV